MVAAALELLSVSVPERGQCACHSPGRCAALATLQIVARDASGNRKVLSKVVQVPA
jgi:hypothetical protein